MLIDTQASLSQQAYAGNGQAQCPLIAHVVFRLDVGGLENGVVNLINGLPDHRYRHAIIAITDHTDFAGRIRRPGVAIYALHKPPGNSMRMQWRLWRLLRHLKPAIVHTRNLGTLEVQLVASLAGVPVRIHGEHGRDVGDLDGSNRKNQWLRRLYSPFVHHYVTVSQNLADYLTETVGIAASRVTRLCNGVDTDKFHPGESRQTLPHFVNSDSFVVGTAGRMQTVKNQPLLAQAFIRALQIRPEARARLRLAMVGDGPLRAEVTTLLERAGMADLAWLPGSRDDVAELMRAMDLFVLPSLTEGISNTILEAMATGLPVLATNVGGNPELVRHGSTGVLVPVSNVDAMAEEILAYYDDALRTRRHGQAARARAVDDFSLAGMVDRYQAIYDQQLSRAAVLRTSNVSTAGK